MTGNDDIGIVPRHFHLNFGFLADDGLVQKHMIQHAAEGVLCIVPFGGIFDRF